MAGLWPYLKVQERQSARQQHALAAQRHAAVLLNKALWCTPKI